MGDDSRLPLGARMDLSKYGIPPRTAFYLAAIATFLISIEALLNSKLRWRQLRSGAGSLESMIWCAAGSIRLRGCVNHR